MRKMASVAEPVYGRRSTSRTAGTTGISQSEPPRDSTRLKTTSGRCSRSRSRRAARSRVHARLTASCPKASRASATQRTWSSTSRWSRPSSAETAWWRIVTCMVTGGSRISNLSSVQQSQPGRVGPDVLGICRERPPWRSGRGNRRQSCSPERHGGRSLQDETHRLPVLFVKTHQTKMARRTWWAGGRWGELVPPYGRRASGTWSWPSGRSFRSTTRKGFPGPCRA